MIGWMPVPRGYTQYVMLRLEHFFLMHQIMLGDFNIDYNDRTFVKTLELGAGTID